MALGSGELRRAAVPPLHHVTQAEGTDDHHRRDRGGRDGREVDMVQAGSFEDKRLFPRTLLVTKITYRLADFCQAMLPLVGEIASCQRQIQQGKRKQVKGDLLSSQAWEPPSSRLP
jgi:hypothetical protein